MLWLLIQWESYMDTSTLFTARRFWLSLFPASSDWHATLTEKTTIDICSIIHFPATIRKGTIRLIENIREKRMRCFCSKIFTDIFSMPAFCFSPSFTMIFTGHWFTWTLFVWVVWYCSQMLLLWLDGRFRATLSVTWSAETSIVTAVHQQAERETRCGECNPGGIRITKH